MQSKFVQPLELSKNPEGFHPVTDPFQKREKSSSTFSESIEAHAGNRLRLLSASLAWFSLLGGALTITGWIFDIPRLTDWIGSGISMFANTALCASFAGGALLLQQVRLNR